MQSKFSQTKQLQLTLKSRPKRKQPNKGPSHPRDRVVTNGVRWCRSAQRRDLWSLRDTGVLHVLCHIFEKDMCFLMQTKCLWCLSPWASTLNGWLCFLQQGKCQSATQDPYSSGDSTHTWVMMQFPLVVWGRNNQHTYRKLAKCGLYFITNYHLLL